MTAHPAQSSDGDRPRIRPVAAALTAVVLLAAVPSAPPLAAGQAPHPIAVSLDRHYGMAIDQQLWANPWAHGYQHGYEDGFHHGEWDHQMFEEPKPVKKQSDWKHADRGYAPDMGKRSLFRDGYRQGFAAGYNDAYGGRAFAALVDLAQRDPAFACLPQCRPELLAERQASSRHRP